MSVDNRCREIARRLETARDEDLARLAREEAGHFEACGSCRSEVALRDPSALFALLAFEKKDEAFFTGFETRVMAEIREAERESRGGWLGAILRPRYLALAGGAAAIAVALVLYAGHSPQEPRVAGVVVDDGAGPMTVNPPGSPESTTAAAPAPSMAIRRDAAPPSPVESVASATARV